MKENKKVKCLPLFERARLSAEFFVFFDGKMYRPGKRKT
jgi:hypothetical protein